MPIVRILGDIVNNDSKSVYEWIGIDCCCPRDIEQAIASANGKKLTVEINSGGGEIFSGSEIYTLLKQYGNVEIIITGLAASAASVIAMAGYCKIAPTGMIMIHNVSMHANGDYQVMSKKSEILRSANQAIASAYVTKTGLREQEIYDLMNKETWFSAKQAKEKGFVDEILFNSNSVKNSMINSNLSIPPKVIEAIKRKITGTQLVNKEDIHKGMEAKLKLLKLKGV